MFEDRRVKFVEMLLWCYDSAPSARAVDDCIKSLDCKSAPFTDEPTDSCGLDEQPICTLTQLSDDFVAWPGRVQTAFLSNEFEVLVQEYKDVVICSRR